MVNSLSSLICTSLWRQHQSPPLGIKCLYLDQFGLMVGLHLFDTSEGLALSWMLLAAGILCAS